MADLKLLQLTPLCPDRWESPFFRNRVNFRQLYTWLTSASSALTGLRFNFNWLRHRYFLFSCKIYWKIQNLSPFSPKKYWVKISRKEKKPFVNITIHLLDHSCKTFDPHDAIQELLKYLDEDLLTLPCGAGGFINNEASIWLTTNCTLVHK